MFLRVLMIDEMALQLLVLPRELGLMDLPQVVALLLVHRMVHRAGPFHLRRIILQEVALVQVQAEGLEVLELAQVVHRAAQEAVLVHLVPPLVVEEGNFSIRNLNFLMNEKVIPCHIIVFIFPNRMVSK